MTANELKVSPEIYFDEWYFDVRDFYWSIFGVKRSEWVDNKKSKIKRKSLKEQYIEDGLSEEKAHKLSMTKGKVMRTGWGVYSIDPADFAEGYSLLSRKDDLRFQILENKDSRVVFAKYKDSSLKLLSIDLVSYKDLVEFLKTGDESLIIPFNPKMLPESQNKYFLINQLRLNNQPSISR